MRSNPTSTDSRLSRLRYRPRNSETYDLVGGWLELHSNRSTAEHMEIDVMKKLVLETTAPFQGLPELVAYDEGLFEKEGLIVEWVDREQGVEKKVEANVTTPKGVNPFTSHGKL